MPRRLVSITKICPTCKFDFTTNTQKAIYCSPRCRVQAHRERHGIQTKQVRLHDKCQREGCEKDIPEHTRANTEYCSNACRQKVYHSKHKEREKQQYTERRDKKRAEKAVEDFIQELMS